MSHHPERTARNVRPVNQPPSFYMSNAEYDFAHAEENKERYDLMLVVGDEVQYIKAPFSKNSKIGKHLKIVEDSWKGFAV